MLFSSVTYFDPRTLQVRSIFRAIDPDEYDTVLRTQSNCCTVFVSKDRRSGRQLLQDTSKDSSLTLTDLASTPEGMASLNQIADAFNEVVRQ